MRYIGCKNNLLSYIEAVTLSNCSREGVFCDLFAGTHTVAAHFKKLGFQIISNDLLYVAYVFGRALIQNNDKPAFCQLTNLSTAYSSNLFDEVDNYSKTLNYLNLLEGTSDGLSLITTVQVEVTIINVSTFLTETEIKLMQLDNKLKLGYRINALPNQNIIFSYFPF